MSTLQTKGFSQIVGVIAAGMQGRITSRFLNFSLGSVFRALAEAVAGICLWIQKQALDIVKLTRLATSYGADVDSFVADFGIITRFAAIAATGQVIFARYTASSAAAYVPVGTIVQTQDGTQRFSVYADTTNPSFVSTYGAGGGYIISAQVSSVVAPVVSVTPSITAPVANSGPGANGNVAADSIVLIASNAPGIDTVTNLAAFNNGIDVESDDNLKTRFRLAVLALGGGTEFAIRSAIANLKSGMQCTIQEGVDVNGAPDPGMVTVFVDDGSGGLAADLLGAAQSAVNTIRAAGCRIGVYAASVQYVTVGFQLAIKTGYYKPTVAAQLDAAVGLLVNSTGQGQGLPYYSLVPPILANPGVAEITSLTINGGTVDIVGQPGTTIKLLQTEIG